MIENDQSPITFATVAERGLNPDWKNRFFNERQRQEMDFAQVYVAQFSHGTDGHHRLQLIARLVQMCTVVITEHGELLKAHLELLSDLGALKRIEADPDATPIPGREFPPRQRIDVDSEAIEPDPADPLNLTPYDFTGLDIGG